MSDPYLTCPHCGVVEPNETLLEFKHRKCGLVSRADSQDRANPLLSDLLEQCEVTRGETVQATDRYLAEAFGVHVRSQSLAREANAFARRHNLILGRTNYGERFHFIKAKR